MTNNQKYNWSAIGVAVSIFIYLIISWVNMNARVSSIETRTIDMKEEVKRMEMKIDVLIERSSQSLTK